MSVLMFCLSVGVRRWITLAHCSVVVCGATHFSWFHLAGTKLAFMSRPATLIPLIFNVLAAVEFVGDKLPKTPARTAPPGLTARIVLGGLSGAAVGASAGIIPYLGAAVASTGV
jgi:uncharacterized membrane protein